MIQFDEKVLCKKCVLPEAKPHIFFHGDGVCNLCHEYQEEKKKEQESKLLESDLLKILNKNKGKGKYDCRRNIDCVFCL